MPIAAPAVPNAGIGPEPADEDDVEHDVQHRHRDAEHHRRARVAGRAQRAAQHEEHQHAAAEQEHDAQERQRFGLHRGRGVHEIEQRTATAK